MTNKELKLLKDEIKLSVCKDTISKLMGKEEEFDNLEPRERLELIFAIDNAYKLEGKYLA